MKELRPAPAEAIDLLERINLLEAEVQKLKEDLGKIIITQGSVNIELGELKRSTKLSERRLDDAFEAIDEIDNYIQPSATPKQRNQGEILNMLLSRSNGMWQPYKEIREKMGLSEEAFSRLLKVTPGVETKQDRSDRRKKLIRRQIKM